MTSTGHTTPQHWAGASKPAVPPLSPGKMQNVWVTPQAAGPSPGSHLLQPFSPKRSAEGERHKQSHPASGANIYSKKNQNEARLCFQGAVRMLI